MPSLPGVDEKAIAKGHSYMTLVCDLQAARVEYIGEERRKSNLAAYFQAFPQQRRQQIEVIRFHIMRHVLEAVDRVRKREHKRLMSQGDSTLAKSKYLWLYSEENVPQRSKEHFQAIKSMQLKTARAWALKESLRQLWNYQSLGWAKRFWQRWYFWATHSRIAPMIEAAKLVARHLPNVMTFFNHRITNAVAEGLNSKIATVQKRACGYRNPNHFKIAVYFHCGGLNLYPALVTNTKPG